METLDACWVKYGQKDSTAHGGTLSYYKCRYPHCPAKLVVLNHPHATKIVQQEVSLAA